MTSYSYLFFILPKYSIQESNDAEIFIGASPAILVPNETFSIDSFLCLIVNNYLN